MVSVCVCMCLYVLYLRVINSRDLSSESHRDRSTERQQSTRRSDPTDGHSVQQSAKVGAASADARADQMRFVVERIDADEYREGRRHVHRASRQQMDRHESMEHRVGRIRLGQRRRTTFGHLMAAHGGRLFVAFALDLEIKRE